MKSKLQDRLNEIIPRLQDKDVLSGAGLGNEIGFYIFDYPAENELEVREHIKFVLDYLTKKRPDLKLAHINLFELIIGYLKERKLLDRALHLQREKGDAELFKALKGPLNEEKVARELIAVADPHDHHMVLLCRDRQYSAADSLAHLAQCPAPTMEGKPLVCSTQGSMTGKGYDSLIA
jgi:hypothetical protein